MVGVPLRMRGVSRTGGEPGLSKAWSMSRRPLEQGCRCSPSASASVRAQVQAQVQEGPPPPALPTSTWDTDPPLPRGLQRLPDVHLEGPSGGARVGVPPQASGSCPRSPAAAVTHQEEYVSGCRKHCSG